MTKIFLPSNLSSKKLEDLGELFLKTFSAIQTDNKIVYDFSSLKFVEPSGYTALLNLIRWLHTKGIVVSFSNFKNLGSRPIIYLDDCGFFKFFKIDCIRVNPAIRQTTIAEVISPQNRHSWYNSSLATWLTSRTGKTQSDFLLLKVCFMEVFQNIADHSNTDKGAIFGQYYPGTNQIIISISDIGIGIPQTVRTILPALSDSACIEKACELGFTVGSTQGNAGRGLANLRDIIINQYNGKIKILSLAGYYEVSKDYTKIKKIDLSWEYPGTSIEIIIDTANLPSEPTETEDFEW